MVGPKNRTKSGFRDGRQAQIIPTSASIHDQRPDGTLSPKHWYKFD
jgi:hypothetical protein